MDRSSTALPSTVIVPVSGRRKPRRHERRVVFPAPLGPISPRVSPRGTSSDTPSSARVSPPKRPYVFDTLETEIMKDSIVVSLSRKLSALSCQLSADGAAG